MNAPAIVAAPGCEPPLPCPTCLGLGKIDELHRDRMDPRGYVALTVLCRTCTGAGYLSPSAATA